MFKTRCYQFANIDLEKISSLKYKITTTICIILTLLTYDLIQRNVRQFNKVSSKQIVILNEQKIFNS